MRKSITSAELLSRLVFELVKATGFANKHGAIMGIGCQRVETLLIIESVFTALLTSCAISQTLLPRSRKSIV